MSQQTLPCTPSPELPRVSSFFSCRYLVLPKNVLKGEPVPFEVIQVKRPKKRGFQHIHSNTILISYMYINFQQNRVSRSVKKILKTVHTNLFAKKIASCINLQLLFETCVIVKRTCLSIFSKLG